MLYLENLEPRRLLSILITESDGDDNGILQSDPAIIGEPPPESYIDITNNYDLKIVTVDNIEISSGVNFYPGSPSASIIQPDESIRIPVYFDPLAAGELEEMLTVHISIDGAPEQIFMPLSGVGLNVSVWPLDNSNLSFYDTGIGQVQTSFDTGVSWFLQDNVSVDYNDGAENSTIVISDIQVTGDDCFSYEQPAPPETLPGGYYYYGFSDYTANEVIELELGVPQTGTLEMAEDDKTGTMFFFANSYRALERASRSPSANE